MSLEAIRGRIAYHHRQCYPYHDRYLNIKQEEMVAGLARIALRSTPLRAATTSTNKMMIARSLHSTSIMRAEVVDKDPQLGDYPQFEPRSTQSRRDDPRYWDRQEKRNFGETLHEQDDVLGVWAPDLHEGVKPASAVRQLLLAASLFASFGGLVYISLPDRPALPRTYPRDGLANELGGKQQAAFAEGAFDKKEEEEEEGEDDE